MSQRDASTDASEPASSEEAILSALEGVSYRNPLSAANIAKRVGEPTKSHVVEDVLEDLAEEQTVAKLRHVGGPAYCYPEGVPDGYPARLNIPEDELGQGAGRPSSTDVMAAFETEDGTPRPRKADAVVSRASGTPEEVHSALEDRVRSGDLDRTQFNFGSVYWPTGGLRSRILSLLDESEGPKPWTPQEVAEDLDGCRNHAAEKCLERLESDGLVESIDLGKRTLYW